MCNSPGEVGEPGKLWRRQSLPSPRLARCNLELFLWTGSASAFQLSGSSCEGPVWFSVSLTFASVDSPPLILLKGVISFPSSCPGMTPEKTYQERRSRIGAETPGMGGGQAAAPDGGLPGLLSRTARKTARRPCWINLFPTRFWLRFPLNSSCYLTWRIQNVTWQASREHCITQFKPCQLSDPLEIHLCGDVRSAVLDCQESVRTAGLRPQLNRKPSHCWVCRASPLGGPLPAGPGVQEAEGQKCRVLGTFWGSQLLGSCFLRVGGGGGRWWSFAFSTPTVPPPMVAPTWGQHWRWPSRYLPDTLPSPLPAPPPAQLLPCCFLGLDFGTPTQPCGGFRHPLSPPGVSSSPSEPAACLSCSWP